MNMCLTAASDPWQLQGFSVGANRLAGELEHIAGASEPFTGALKRASA